MNLKFLKKSILFIYIFTLISMIPLPIAHSMHNMANQNHNSGEIIKCMACADEVGECYHLDLKIHTPTNSGAVKNHSVTQVVEETQYVDFNNCSFDNSLLNKNRGSLKFLNFIILRC